MATYMEQEIKKPMLLCDRNGKLAKESIGWARSPLIIPNLTGHHGRKKKWNYWCVFGEEALFCTAITHFDYAAVCFVYYLDYKTNKFHEKQVIMPLGSKCTMPNGIEEDVSFMDSKLAAFFIQRGDYVDIRVSSPDFDGKPLKAEISIYCPPEMESLNVVIPWSAEKFQYTSKQTCLQAEGFFSIGDDMYHFSGERDYACLDFGRGDWPREISWNWATASSKQGDKVVGLNVGGKWTDGTGMTENAYMIDGIVTKISEDVLFEYDENDLMKPWTIRTKESDTLNLTFIPFFKRVAKSNLVLVKSEFYQLVGHFQGEIRLDNGELVTVKDMLGGVEDHMAKW